jgi:shikimate dehydrogenase
MPPEVNGKTDVYLMLGDPVDQVRAPAALNAVFRRFGIDAVMVPARVPSSGLAAFVRSVFEASNILGLSITIPHKNAVMEVVDHLGPSARLAGAVNAIRRGPNGLEGEMLDGTGCVASLRHFGVSTDGARALVLGAGGAAAAIAAALGSRSDGAPAEIALYDPVPGRAQALAARFDGRLASRVFAVASSDPAGFDVVVNASPLGLDPQDPAPCDAARLAPHAAVFDILMKNQPTPLVRAARARGLRAEPGYEMLVQQVHLYLAYFGHVEAARAMREDAAFVRTLVYPAE